MNLSNCSVLSSQLHTVVCILVRTASNPISEETINSAEKNDTSFERAACFLWDEAKKNQNGKLKKNSFSSSANSQYFFMKFLWFGPWVSRIDWCEGHWNVSTYMVVRLSDKQPKNTKNTFFVCFWAYVGQPHNHISWDISMPFASINSTNPRTKP